MPPRPSSLRGQVFALVLALAVPAIALEAWWGYREYADATTRARDEALAIAEQTAVGVQQFLGTAGEVMTGMAREFQDSFEDPEDCASLVRTLTDVLPFLRETFVRTPDGSVVCASGPPPPAALTASLPPAPELAARPAPWVSDPTLDARSDSWVLPITVAIPDGEDAPFGSLVSMIPLEEFHDLLGGIVFDASHLVTIATADLQVITRSRDAGSWIGRTLPTPENPDIVVGPGQRVASGPDADRVQRAWGISAIPDLGWEIFVGVPEDEVNGPALATALRRVGVTAVFLLAGILLALVSYRRIAGSLRQLVARTRDVPAGSDVPLPPGTPDEVSAVVAQFNQTLTALTVAETAERRAHERYEGIFNDAVFGIFVATPDGRMLEANPALASMLGYGDPGPVMAVPLREHFQDPDGHDIMLATCLEQGRLEGFMADWVRADGTPFVVRIDGKAVRLRDGSPAVEMIVEDVTEELRRDRELRQTQKMEAIGRLAGGIAHDFNNLLTVIRANADLAEESLPARSPALRDLQQIRAAADRAAALTRQLLAFSRGDPSGAQPVDLNLLISELEALLKRLIGEHIRLETRLAPDLPLVEVDPGRIEQMVMNLVLNARDAMPDGGNIVIGTELAEPWATEDGGEALGVALTVRDEGSGMDAITRARIFEPFFTTKRDSGGTGLGLATVYAIVQKSGGRIDVDSELGVGTTFHVRLPLGHRNGAVGKA